ncbi:hypothetical protein L9F63_017816, partial [Diploptera punctata]
STVRDHYPRFRPRNSNVVITTRHRVEPGRNENYSSVYVERIVNVCNMYRMVKWAAHSYGEREVHDMLHENSNNLNGIPNELPTIQCHHFAMHLHPLNFKPTLRSFNQPVNVTLRRCYYVSKHVDGRYFFNSNCGAL